MKNYCVIALFTFFSLLFPAGANAQQTAVSDVKKEKCVTKEYQYKAIKEARKEAKKLLKEGYQSAEGKLPLDKQVENSWQKQVETDANGNHYWYVASSNATAFTLSDAISLATNVAKTDLAEQIQANLTELITLSAENNNITPQAATRLTGIIKENRSTIYSTLTRTIPLVEIFRPLFENDIEARVTLGYSLDAANQAAVKAIRKILSQGLDELVKELDKLGY